MKIGILTFHRALNYGAVLQCYALQNTLEKEGYEVEIVDYRQAHTEIIYSPFSFSQLFNILRHGNLKSALVYIIQIHKRIVKKRCFSSFSHTYLHMSNKVFLSGDSICGYDSYVIGSDQLWNQFCTGGYEPVYWGDFDGSKAKIAYAISTNVPMLNHFKNDELWKNLKRFYYISCRELEVADYLHNVTGLPIDVTIDPTLLMDKKEWIKMVDISNSQEKYVLIYSVRGELNILRNMAYHVAGDNMKVIEIDCEVTPHGFVSLIYHANCIITSSFHATVFSVIMNKPFWSVKYGDNHDARYVNFLSNVCLQSQLVAKDFIPYIPQIDFSIANQKLKDLRMESLCKLLKALSNE